MYSDGSDYVSIAFPTEKKGDPKVIEGIGKKFDEVLKTGKYDGLFGSKKTEARSDVAIWRSSDVAIW